MTPLGDTTGPPEGQQPEAPAALPGTPGELPPTALPNVLSGRYASAEMNDLWSPRNRVVCERRLWIAVMRSQASLGVHIGEDAIAAYESVVDRVDFESIAAREARTRHDVKARIEEFCALAGHEQIHRGMTSRDLTENVDQMLIRRSLALLRDRLVGVLARLAERARRHADLVIVARTHNVAAQAGTLGKRFANAAEETMLGIERIEELLARYPLRGVKGAVGTRADQLDLLGDPGKVELLEQAVAQHLGFERVLDSVGQVYPRSLDLDVVSAVTQAVCGPADVCTTLRLMAGHELVTEGFADGQVGSTAMPHKMNARSAERVGALRAVIDGHLAMAAGLAGRQWNEGDVSCSAARRMIFPDAFLAADGLLQTAMSVLDDMAVFEALIDDEVQRDLPFLATTRLLAAVVAAGVGREHAHEMIREHAVQAVHDRRCGRGEPTLVDRLADDPQVPLDRAALQDLIGDPLSFTGTALDQTRRVAERADEIVERHAAAAAATPQVRV